MISPERIEDLEKRQQYVRLYQETYGEPPAIFQNILREALGLAPIPYTSLTAVPEDHMMYHLTSRHLDDGNFRIARHATSTR